MNIDKKQQLSLWRWHFYSGLYVVPFMLMLALTGIVMMVNPQIEEWRYSELIFVDAPATLAEPPARLSASQQLAAVKAAYPGFRVRQYQPPTAADRSSRFKIRSRYVSTQIIFVNPYTADILGRVDSKSTLYALADNIHGTLLLGKTGDALIELSAGLTFILLISGVYLYWPKNGSGLAQLFLFRLKKNSRGKLSRNSWRSVHGSLGIWLSVVLFLFALTGMAWTGIWGQKLVQPFSSFPQEKRAGYWRSDAKINRPSQQLTHADLNTEAENEVPWNLEQVPVPQSAMPSPDSTEKSSLDSVIQQGQELGFDYFRVALPTTPSGVYTLMSITSSGDVIDPRQDRTVHIDQYSGKVLADIGWQDYNLIARAMAAAIPLHKGQVSVLNLVANILICLLLIVSSIAGIVLWFKRRNKSQGGIKPALSAPPRVSDRSLPRGAQVLFVMTAVLFPVTGAAMLLFWLYDWLRGRAESKTTTPDEQEENIRSSVS